MLVFQAVTADRHKGFGGTYRLYFNPENGSDIFLRNVDIYLQDYKTSQPRRTTMQAVKRVGLGGRCLNPDHVAGTPTKCTELLAMTLVCTADMISSCFQQTAPGTTKPPVN